MNEVFNPSLVVSLGNSGKKAIDFLDNMTKEFPVYLKNLIEFINIDDINLEELEDLIQKIIDEKLLSSKNLNKLVDFGYKSRIYECMDIKINIYFFLDLYDSSKKAEDIINILYKINYGNIDKNKFWGVSLFIMPIIDKEWGYNELCIKNGIENLKNIENYISEPNKMVNINSKIFLLHSIAKDGARISRNELEYICAIIAFLNIIPSTDPPLNSLKDKILKRERKFKIGTIGIATLNVFKEEIMNYVKIRFKKDVIEYGLTYKEKINYKDKFKQPIIDNEYINTILLKDIDFNNEDSIIDLEYNKLSNFIKKNDNLKKEDILKNELKEWEENFIEKYNNKIINKINFNQKRFCKEIKKNIKINLDSIIKEYSFMQGEDYLNTLYISENIKYYNNEFENKSNIEKILKIQKDLKKNLIKTILFNLLITLSTIYILLFNNSIKFSYKITIIIIM
ncbi:hypothetical protein GBZ86_13115, partial [Clostridium tarantellae]|nr:hypothetical protein [Clostridium tarantellae]